MSEVNLFDDEWQDGFDRPGYFSGMRQIGKELGGEKIGATLYKVDSGCRMFPYHYHYAEEEWLLVLDGEPTLRMPDGERKLRAGDVVAFPVGPRGAHEVRNETGATVRVLVLSTKAEVEVAVYPDSGKIGGSANRLGPGERIRILNRPEANLDYFDGEA
jgi:uncharacterized cupin superfamily protein